MGFFKYSICAYFFIFATHSIQASPIQVNHLAKGLTEFSTDFYLQCAQTKPGNVIVSPLSVSSALALLAQGTSGKTFEELKNALHLNFDKAAAADKFLEHRESLENNAGNSTLAIANRIYVQQGQRLNKNFEDVSTSKFKSGIESINFADSEKSARKINHFVEAETNGKIKDLISSDMLGSDTRSVIVNAVYFKGNWAKPFTKDFTSKQDFYVSETDKVKTDFMYVNGAFNYAYLEELEASALEMKYENSSISFVVVLPNKRMGLSALETKLKNYDLKKIPEKMHLSTFDVNLPKFKVEYEIKLNEVLKNMGMTEMFSESDDLNGFLESGEPLNVSDVVHKAVIEIDEKGAEAAAATGMVIMIESLPPQFRADHPFMYFIRDTVTNTVIFSGCIVNFN